MGGRYKWCKLHTRDKIRSTWELHETESASDREGIRISRSPLREGTADLTTEITFRKWFMTYSLSG